MLRHALLDETAELLGLLFGVDLAEALIDGNEAGVRAPIGTLALDVKTLGRVLQLNSWHWVSESCPERVYLIN